MADINREALLKVNRRIFVESAKTGPESQEFQTLQVYEKPTISIIYRKIFRDKVNDTDFPVDGVAKSGMGMCKHTWI